MGFFIQAYTSLIVQVNFHRAIFFLWQSKLNWFLQNSSLMLWNLQNHNVFNKSNMLSDIEYIQSKWHYIVRHENWNWREKKVKFWLRKLLLSSNALSSKGKLLILNLYYQLLQATFSEMKELDTYCGVQIFYDARELA